MSPIAIGIIGCGNISEAYLKGAARSGLIDVKAVADVRTEAAEARAEEFGVQALSIDALLADPDIRIVLNLTVPQAHAAVSRRVIASGKHVFSEKPLGLDVAEGRALLAEAAARGLRVGCAPDTFLGAGHQACRAAIDAGLIGTPVGGVATVQSRGMEAWHPNPGFFFTKGGGPIFDIGPYYITQLVNLFGPVARLASQGSIGTAERVVGSGPLAGQSIPIEVPTTVNAVLLFANGANVTLSHSWDVWSHRRLPFEIYGTEGSLLNPDPNFFGGVPEISQRGGAWTALDIGAHPYGTNNRTTRAGLEVADHRIIGLLDMAAAIGSGRPHRANGDLALHVLEVMEAIDRSSIEGRHIAIESRCARPDPVPLGSDESVFL
jgi:predicted dehydrogenase